jgi:hypothetical protein
MSVNNRDSFALGRSRKGGQQAPPNFVTSPLPEGGGRVPPRSSAERAEAEAQRAEAERRARLAAEQELAQLRARLAENQTRRENGR